MSGKAGLALFKTVIYDYDALDYLTIGSFFMILIGMGANLDSDYGAPLQTLSAAVLLMGAGMNIVQKSRVWKSAPVPYDPSQNWYHNAVVEVDTNLSPESLLAALLEIEEGFGRIRTVKNAPRVLDLDLIAYNEQVYDSDDLTIPHPRMHDRLFVLNPLSDLNDQWVHPLLNKSIDDLLKNIPAGQEAEPLDEPW